MTVILMLFSGITVSAYNDRDTITDEINGIIAYRLEKDSCGDIQAFIDGWITDNAGSSEADWYACTLARSGNYDFSAYHAALAKKSTNGNPTERQRIAAAQIMTGGAADAASVIDSTYGKLGIMSRIYGLILMKLSGCGDISDAVSDLVSLQLEDGGWALSGNVSDPDVTALALQALSGCDDCESSIDKALTRLSELQQDNGGWRNFGTDTSESCSQVIMALTTLDVDIFSDARFIKNGNTALDALMEYKLENGGFSHISGGKANSTATVQALMAFTTLKNGSFYQPYEHHPQEVSTAPPTSAADVTEASTESSATEPSAVITNSAETITETAQSKASSETSLSTEAVTAASSSDETSAETSSDTQTQTSAETTQSESGESCESAEFSESTSVESVTAAAASSDDSSRSIFPWKIAFIAVIGLSYVGTLLFLAARKQLGIAKTLGGAALSAVCIGAVLLVNIQTPQEYYNRHIDDIQPDSLTFTLTVDAGKADPENGMIIPETEFVLVSGDTAFSALERVLAYNRIALDYGGSSADAYIKGIDGIYEFEHGEMSGWMYTVNGEFPSVGCGSFKLSDGDCVSFIYTRNIGHDIGAEVQQE